MNAYLELPSKNIYESGLVCKLLCTRMTIQSDYHKFNQIRKTMFVLLIINESILIIRPAHIQYIIMMVPEYPARQGEIIKTTMK